MKLSITDSDLKIKFSAFEKILGMHGSFEFPLSCVKKASVDFAVPSSLKDARMPGTHLPGIIKAGTYLTTRGKEFWYTTRKKQFLVLELDDEKQPYKRIILSINNNVGLKNHINSKICPA